MVQVDSYDNRGGDEVAYGFVYFTDGRRVAYTSSNGVVGEVTGGWPGITADHESAAIDYLIDKGVLNK